ncbi:MAG: hypothetical protein ACJAZ8_001961 [Planctomycetota bacterium]|jgi:hypothetical protein
MAKAPDPGAAVPFEVEFLYLEADLQAPGTAAGHRLDYGTHPLALAVDLALATDRRAGVLGAPQLFSGARIASGPSALAAWTRLTTGEAGRASGLLSYEGLLWPGVAGGFEVRLMEDVVDRDNFLREYPERGSVPKAVLMRVGFDGAFARAGIGIASAAPRLDPDDLLSPEQALFRPGGPAPLEEWVRPTLQLTAASSPMVVLVPSPFNSGDGRTLALRFSLGQSLLGDQDEVSRDALETEVMRALESAERTAFLRFGARRDAPVSSTERTVFAALEGLRYATDLRAVFAYLTGVLEPPLALDLVLTADKDVLAKLAERVATDRLLTPETMGPDAGLGGSFDAKWSMERGAWTLLVDRALASALTPGDASLMLRHGGEVGRFPTLLEGALGAARNTSEFIAYLERENGVFLSDASPAARVRAFDWLSARGMAPEDFNPLGTRGERRRVLDKLRAEREALLTVGPATSGGADQ